MDFLQNSTVCQWVGAFLIFYALIALFICFFILVPQKFGALSEDEEPTPKDVVNYFLIGGGVAGGLTALLGIVGFISGSPETRKFFSPGDMGFALIAMILIVVLVSFLAPLITLAVTFLLKVVIVTGTYLGATLIIKPLQAWGDFLTRKTSNGEEGE